MVFMVGPNLRGFGHFGEDFLDLPHLRKIKISLVFPDLMNLVKAFLV